MWFLVSRRKLNSSSTEMVWSAGKNKFNYFLCYLSIGIGGCLQGFLSGCLRSEGGTHVSLNGIRFLYIRLDLQCCMTLCCYLLVLSYISPSIHPSVHAPTPPSTQIYIYTAPLHASTMWPPQIGMTCIAVDVVVSADGSHAVISRLCVSLRYSSPFPGLMTWPFVSGVGEDEEGLGCSVY